MPRIKLDTTMAHPTLGVLRPGDVIDLSKEAARPLLEAGYAELTTEKLTSAIAADSAKQKEAEIDRRAARLVRNAMAPR